MMIKSEEGFSLLEAVVAMVLLASAGVSVFGWINGTLNSLHRIESVQKEQQILQNALTFIENVNPMRNPGGDAATGNLTLHWESRLVEPPRRGAGYPFGDSLYRLGLYDVDVTARTEDVQTHFTVRLAGYEQVEAFRTGF